MALLRSLIIESIIFFILVLTEANGSYGKEGLATLEGRWQVVGVRIDETLMRTPNYNINDPALMGRWIKITKNKITTNLPEKSKCQTPSIKAETSTISDLINLTMGRTDYNQDEPNKFRLPENPNEKREVLWVTCTEGDIGPDYPFGPENYNWIARLSDNKLALRWYDNTILLLKRQ
ncbi:hypothetical protein Gbem_2783 [Citrifermentans bemidjiense Bem]|uniref:Uncharacterized protein n=1 Tax=Citrifermentans bemidjiense (strain ATCC BAA-1014 / DSM 16622 / JCM 12645 / Bem) TaxID=404380 RepID=B5EHY8_CITBB|nr:hypothetical protein [Citrifermentans bemidjiense]ACH39787.1 hypothetical protein Gbem_2783 [Citrifermentans bemidjiense Bem]